MAEIEFIFKDISGLIGGLDTSTPPPNLEEIRSPNLLNVFADMGELRSDTGYTTFGSVIEGYPQLATQLFYKDGTDDLILVTTTRCYIWTSSEWQLIPGPVMTTLSAAAAADDLVISVVDVTGFSDNDDIIVELDNGHQHKTTINGAPDTADKTITLTDAMPSGAAIGNKVGIPAVLNGYEDNQVNFTQWTADDKLIITNNIDNVKQFDGVQLIDVPNLPSSGNTKAANVLVYENYLLLANTVEGGTRYPQRIRWCDTGDPTNWSTGNAGFEDLYDTEDYILSLMTLGPYGYIYRERSIYRISYVGSPDLLFTFEMMVAGEGVVSSQAAVDIGDYHVFFGNSNIYRYDGDFSIQPIADRIYYKIFGTSGILNPAYKTRVFGLYVEELDEIWFFLPSTECDVPDTLVRYSIVHEAMFIRKFNDKFLGYGFYTATSGKTWAELVGSWYEQTWTWDSRRLLANAPITLLCGYDNKQVYSYDYIASDDNRVPISWYFETKDFSSPSSLMRFDMLEFEGTGEAVNVSYSTDEGGTWTSMFNGIVGSDYSKIRIWKQIITDKIRFKFSGDVGGFSLRRIRLKLREESTW
jgi:hypothetical protein